MADRTVAGDTAHQQQKPIRPPMHQPRFHPHNSQHPSNPSQPSQNPQPIHLPPLQAPQHHQNPQHPQSQQMSRHNTHAPRQPQNHPMQYSMRPPGYTPRMPVQSPSMNPTLPPYYQPDRRIPQTQLPTDPAGQTRYNDARNGQYQRGGRERYSGPVSDSTSSYSTPMYPQSFGPMAPYINPSSNAMYGQTYMPQPPYMPANPYSAQIQPARPQSQYPIKRERKALPIVNPVTHEVVTSSKSKVEKAPAVSQPPKPTPVATTPEATKVEAPASSTLDAYRTGSSRALKIEAPSLTDTYAKPQSKALKIEAPPKEELREESTAVKESDDSRAEHAVQSSTATRNVHANTNGSKFEEPASTPKTVEVDNAAPVPAPKSQEKEVPAETSASSHDVRVTESPPVQNEIPNEQETPVVDDSSSKTAEEDSVSTTKLNVPEAELSSNDVKETLKAGEDSKSLAKVAGTQAADAKSEGEPKTAALNSPSSPEGQVSAPMSLQVVQGTSGDTVDRKHAISETREKTADPIVEAVTPEVSSDLSSRTGAAVLGATKAKLDATVADSNTEGDLSWRKSGGSTEEDSTDKSWREKKTGLSIPPIDETKVLDTSEGGSPSGRTPMKRQRPKAITHEAGARRVYDLQWMSEMRMFFVDAKPLVEARVLGKIMKASPPDVGNQSSKASHGGGRGGGGAQWARGQQMSYGGSVFPGMGGKGGGQYMQADRGPRRGVKLPPAPTPQSQNWRDGSRRQDLPPINRGPVLPPVAPLKRSENAWGRKREDDDDVAAKRKTVRSILNKLTPEKFERLYKQLIAVEITTVDVLDGIVREIFEKAVLEPKFADMYAELCQRLSKEAAEMLAAANLFSESGKPITFKRMLVTNVVQAEFQRFANAENPAKEAGEEEKKREKEAGEKEAGEQEAAEKEASEKEAPKKEEKETSKTDKKTKGKPKEELRLDAVRAKRRMLGNINFIGELYKKSLIPEQKIHQHCVQKLLNLGIKTREDDVLEALCKLLASVGQKLSENVKAKAYMDKYFTELDKLSRDHSLPSRIRFMMQNLIEMRQNNWKRRREEVKAKKISEVHADIQREQRQKQEASSRNRGRSGGGRYPSRFDRPMSRGTNVPLTMAPPPARSRTTPTVSRAVKSREMFNSMGGQGKTPSASGDVRLAMPSSRRPLGGTGSATGVSLKPGGSTRFSANAFSALVESDESTSQGSANTRLKPMRSRDAGRAKPMQRVQSSAEAQKPGLDPQKIRDKAKSYLQEFLSIGDMKEAKECVQIEIPEVNHTAFIESALGHALDMKPQDGERLIPVFVEWLSIVDKSHYRSALSNIMTGLDDIEMDSPNAGVFLSKCLGRLAALGKLSKSSADPAMGLDFLSSCVKDIMDGKRTIKLVVRTFAELNANLTAQTAEKDKREETVCAVFSTLDIDLKALAIQWNAQKGVSVLTELLSECRAQYLVPLLGIDEKVRTMLFDGKTGKEIAEVVRSSVPNNTLGSPRLARILTRAGLAFACDETKNATKDSLTRQQIEVETKRLKSSSIPLLLDIFGKAETDEFAAGRFAVIVEAQRFCFEHKYPPGVPDAKNQESKLISRLFWILYDEEVVDEDTLKKWREDMGESDKAGGKGDALVQTQKFFNWLENAETEE